MHLSLHRSFVVYVPAIGTRMLVVVCVAASRYSLATVPKLFPERVTLSVGSWATDSAKWSVFGMCLKWVHIKLTQWELWNYADTRICNVLGYETGMHSYRHSHLQCAPIWNDACPFRDLSFVFRLVSSSSCGHIVCASEEKNVMNKCINKKITRERFKKCLDKNCNYHMN